MYMNNLPKEVVQELERFEKGKAKVLELAKYYNDNEFKYISC